jgi:hypothetical protein
MTFSPEVPQSLKINYDVLCDANAPLNLRLGAAASVAANLDSFTRTLVLSARAEGMSWQLIGTSLYVTKQAAMQRFRPIP